MKNFFAAAAAATVIMGSAAHAAPVLIDFEFGSAGDVISGETVDGVTFSSGDGPLVLFNSNCGGLDINDNVLPDCSGNDGDLATGPSFGTEPQGLVLIIEESSDLDPVPDPDDSAAGGTITFDFDVPVIFELVEILDIDSNPMVGEIVFTFTDADANVVPFTGPTPDSGTPGENSLLTYNFLELDVVKLEIELPGSGAITALAFTSPDEVTLVPLPAGAWLMLTGLGAIGFARRRKKS